MNRPLAIAGAVILLVVVALAIRRVRNEQERQAEREAIEHEQHRSVDLSALPSVPDRPEPTKPSPPPLKFKKRPVIVELVLKQKSGKGTAPFRGRYRVIDAAGSVVSEEQGSTHPATMILTPGRYELVVPGSGFRHPLNVVGDQERSRVTVVISK